MLNLGMSLSLVAGRQRGGAAFLQFSATSVAEDAEIGDAVCTLSVDNLPSGVTVSSYAITDDPDSKFAIDGDDLEVNAALDFNEAASHSVTVTATLSDASTVVGTATITVLDVTDGQYPYAFETLEISPAELESNQGVAINAAGDRLWATGGEGGGTATQNWVIEYDLDFNEVNKRNFYGLGILPSGITQMNGITWHDGKLYVGGNNYPQEPAKGWIFEVDPDTLELLATHETGAFWCEGGAVYGDSFFAAFHNTHDVEEYDLATWTLQGSHPNGFSHENVHFYQGAAWFNDCILLPVHNEQSYPKMIDVSEWDGSGLTPLYRVESPETFARQGFSFSSDLLTAWFAGRNSSNGPTHRIVKAYTRNAPLRSNTPNEESTQREDLLHWYSGLDVTGGAGTFACPDLIGSNDGTVSDEGRVFPVAQRISGKVVPMVRMAGHGVSPVPSGTTYIDLGDLFPTSVDTVAISMWLRIIESNGKSVLLQGNGTGSNVGDWSINANDSATGRMRVYYTAGVGTTIQNLYSPVDTFQLGELFHFGFKLTPSGMTMWKNGVQIAANAVAGLIGGGQNVKVGSNVLDEEGAHYEWCDLRVGTNIDMTAIYAAPFDMWA